MRTRVARPRGTAACLATLAVAALTLAACEPTGSTSTASSTPTTTTAPPSTTSPSPTGVDPLVPYSPPPKPITDRTSGFAGDTIAVPDSEGGTMHVTLVSTAIGPVATSDGRPFSLWFTIENAQGPPWSGFPGGYVTVTDLSGATWDPIPNPTKRDLHPDPERYHVSNRDLHKAMTIGRHDSVSGVSVFRIPGGYREVTVAISFDKGTTWATFDTSFGPY